MLKTMIQRHLAWSLLAVLAAGTPGAAATVLHTLYLSQHAWAWLAVQPGDPEYVAWETWPGRYNLVYPTDVAMRQRYEQIMQAAGPDTGLLIVPNGMETDGELIALGQQYFGNRCVVTTVGRPPAERLGPDFDQGIRQDRDAALGARAPEVGDEAFEHEFQTWTLGKAWITDMKRQLEARGYTFDPATVQFICWGGDWDGCAASYPIQMGRALGLARPIERRWDLIIHDSGPMDIQSTLISQNSPLPGNIRLFIYRNAANRYCAEFWEGIHGPMDRAHRITLNFPPNSVRLIDRFDQPREGNRLYGQVTVTVGCGGHTPYRETIVEAMEGLSLNDFSAALTSGTIAEVGGFNGWAVKYDATVRPEDSASVYYTKLGGGGSFNLRQAKPWPIDEVAAGIYHMSSINTNAGAYYDLPMNTTSYQALNSDLGYTVEMRSRLVRTDEAEWSAAMIDMDEGRLDAGNNPVGRYWSLGFYTDGAGRNYALFAGNSQAAPIEIGSDFHTYRIAVKATTATLYVDGNPTASVPTRALNTDKLRFGDLTGSADGDWAVDYIYICDGGAVPPPSDVHGQVILSGRPGDPGDTCVTVDLRHGEMLVKTATVILNSAGGFAVSGVDAGTYDIAIKANCWLRKVIPNVVVDGPVILSPVTLLAGDLDGDDEVTAMDLSIILSNMDQVGDQ